MDHVAKLIDAFSHPSAADRQWPTYDGQNAFKCEIVRQLEDYTDDPRVLTFFLAVLADHNEFDLARIDMLEMLEWKPWTEDERAAIWPIVLQSVLHDPDEVVRSYAAMALNTYQNVPQVVAAAESVVRNRTEERNVRSSAFSILERLGPTDRVVTLLRDLCSDEEFAPTALRLLREWGEDWQV